MNCLTGAMSRFGQIAVLAFALQHPSLAAEQPGATTGQVDVSPSGSFSYSIPISVPVGTTGLQPAITLQYDSLSGNGPAGMGWTIGGLTIITRCATSYSIDGTQPGAPGLDGVDFDGNDKFCLNGQRLVPVSGAYGAPGTEYRTLQDEFSKIVSYGRAGSGPQYFRVWRKSGEILEYGNTTDSRIEAAGRSDVWTWAINRLSDTAGNYQTFTYTEYAGNPADPSAGGYRLDRIDYTGNEAQGLLPYNRVEFIYQSRPDISAVYQAGSKIVQRERLTNIKVYAGDALFRDYRIAYGTNEVPLPQTTVSGGNSAPGNLFGNRDAQAAALTGRSRPASITECASSAAGSIDCFPPTTFNWAPAGNATFNTTVLKSAQGVPTPDGTWKYYNAVGSGDFNGDGLTDIYLAYLDSKGRALSDNTRSNKVLLATGNRQFTTITIPASAKIPVQHTVAATGDFNGDGLTDIYSFKADDDGRKTENVQDQVRLSRGDGTFTIITLPLAASAPRTSRVLATGDFNGDGLTDLFLLAVQSGSGSSRISSTNGTGAARVLLGSPNGVFVPVTVGTPRAGGTGAGNFVPGTYDAFNDHAIPATGDFNGDGLTDMYVMRSDKRLRKEGYQASDYYWLAKWVPNGTSGTLTFEHVKIPFNTSMKQGKGIANAGDYNGDGLVDFYVIDMDSNGRGSGNLNDQVWLGKGNLSFSVVPGLSNGGQIADEYKIVGSGDFNGDGLTDAYVMPTQDDHANGAKESSADYLLVSNGDGRFTRLNLAGQAGLNWHTGVRYKNGLPAMEHYEVKANGDFDGDGLTDIYLAMSRTDGRLNGNSDDVIFSPAWAFPDQLTGITNGLGLKTQISYKPLTDSSVYTKGTGAIHPVQDVVAARHVVAAISTDDGIGGQNVQTYAYEALRSHINDLGTLGFAKMRVTDGSTGIRTESLYSQDWTGLTEGLLLSSKTIAPDGTVMTDQNLVWGVAQGATADGTPRRFRHTVSSTTVKRDLDGSSLGTETTVHDYAGASGDTFGNHGFPALVRQQITSPDGSTVSIKTTESIYQHDTQRWILGRVTQASVRHSETGKPDITRHTSFTYAADTGLLVSETVQPGTSLSFTKTNSHDGFGAIATLTESWGDAHSGSVRDGAGQTIQSRTSAYVYDAQRRFRVSETNPLGHSQSTVYDPVTGLATATTGPNGLTTSWPERDAFGRTLKELRADGTYTLTEIARCGGAIACPANGALRTRTTVHGADGAPTGPAQTVYQDKLLREIRTSTPSFDGRLVNVDTVHDAKGRVIRKSEPYFEGAATIYWTDIQYDLLNRPVLTRRPDSSTQQMIYRGLVETSINELGQTKTSVKDAAGRQIRVTDNLGTSIIYAYDAIGQMTAMEVEGLAATRSTFTYDERGNKIADSDPDKGAWSYGYDALGQLAVQTDAMGRVTVMTYDVLGRMLSRADDAAAPGAEDRTARWAYDSAPLGATGFTAIGKPAFAALGGYRADYAYDSYLRDAAVTETVGGTSYITETSYDAASRIAAITYPSGVAMRNVYAASGFLAEIRDDAAGTAYWTALEADARGNVTRSRLGNGVEQIKAYDAQRGWLTGIASQKPGGPLLQSLSYSFNQLGNLARRADGEFGADPVIETITYDGLNRLARSETVRLGADPWSEAVDVAYDALGNIVSKSDVGAYGYGGGACGGGIHAVTEVSGPKASSYCYDANGNMVSGGGRTIAYGAAELPVLVAKGAFATRFAYGPDRQRYFREDVTAEGLTRTLTLSGGAFEEIVRPDGAVERRTTVAGLAVVKQTGFAGAVQRSVAFLLTDHLGSVDAIADAAGHPVQKMSFDAWGKRRQTSWRAAAADPWFDTSITARGFTGHEMIDTVGLVHMNGRVYDPELARFVSADPFVQDATNSQSLNRYAYVLNNPLSMTDPTGFFFGSIAKAIGNFFGAIFKAVASAIRAALKVPLIRAVIQIAACGFTGPVGVSACIAASGALALAAGGGLEDALKAMAFAAASFGTWTAIGTYVTPALKAVADGSRMALAAMKGAVHGVVGGALSLAQGGSFIDGFVANAMGAAAGVFSEGVFGPAGSGGAEGFFGRTATAALAGGSASALTGGKFANGALTAAFAQMWNGEGMSGALTRTGSLRGLISSLTYPIAKAIGEIFGQQRVYVTYILRSPSLMRYYLGRASGYGSPVDVLYRRLVGHYHYMVKGYTDVTIDQVAYGEGARAAIRGREQQLIDHYGGVGSYDVANSIRAVSMWNSQGWNFWDASNQAFGRLAPYTGY